MARSCTTFDHTADVGLEARADSLAELYQALGEGLGRFLCASPARGEERRSLAVEAEDLEALVVDFLWALQTELQARRFVLASLEVGALEEGPPARIAATLLGERYDPARHELAAEVKAITWHGLEVAREGEGWRARVILDL